MILNDMINSMENTVWKIQSKTNEVINKLYLKTVHGIPL